MLQAGRVVTLVVAIALAAFVLHDAIPHEGFHQAFAEAEPTKTPTRGPETTPTRTPERTFTPTAMPSLTATVTATQTSTSTPTNTPIPPTATPVPPTNTPVPVMLEGVPLCTDHDKTVWHPLVKKNAAGAILCTYGHEHHDDPSLANSVFGPPSAWWGGTQTISYPWQTSNATTGALENDAKHEGYKWYVGMNQPCTPASPTNGTDGCFLAWRIQVHAMGHASDATTRYHSYAMEALVQHPDGTQGIIRHVGWIDTGHLALNVDTPPDKICPALPTNPAPFTCGSGVHRAHSGANPPAPYTAHASYFANWYATQQYAQVAVHIEEWGPIDYQNPSNQLYFGAAANNSRGRPELMSVDLRQSRWNPFKDAQGRVTFNGFADKFGNVVASCSPLGVECTPFVIEGVEQYGYQWSANITMPGGALTGSLVDHEHDVMSPSTGRSLIRFPN